MPAIRKALWILIALAVLVALVLAATIAFRPRITGSARSEPVEPFNIASNLYYVGASDVTSFLLTGPEGHVLIDGGHPSTAPLILDSIRKLGFDIADVRVLVNSHAHFDHSGGLAALQQASGAALWISEPDAGAVAAGRNSAPNPWYFRLLDAVGVIRYPAARVDHRFKDGEKIRVGPVELTAHVTGGHTPGCTSWSFPVREGDRDLLAVSICSLTLLPGVSLLKPETYPGIADDFERSFATLRQLPADIFLASHPFFFSMDEKLQARTTAAVPSAPFIDREGYLRYIDGAEEKFRALLAEQQ